MSYLPRYQEEKLRTYLKQFSVVLLTGPRQAGKSTLLKHIKQPEWEYYNLDERGLVRRANEDPDLFIQDIKTPAIVDEAQKAPPIFHAIKAAVDENPRKRFILSGSANFQLMEKITETLAGRVGIVELLPFSLGELQELGRPRFLAELVTLKSFSSLQSLAHSLKVTPFSKPYYHLLWGGLPKVHFLRSHEQRRIWFENYRTTYLERDLRNLAEVGHLEDFQKFYQSLAFQTANILNLSNLSNEIGVSVPTCQRYLDILKTSYQAFTLPPYHTSMKARLVKTPKVYFLDTGLVCFFLRYESENVLQHSGHLGALFETWVLNEIKKVFGILPFPPSFSFWRVHAGPEVDLILERGEFLYPVEIKHAVKVTPQDVKGLHLFLETVKGRTIPFGIIFYRGNLVQTVTDRILAVPVEFIWH